MRANHPPLVALWELRRGAGVGAVTMNPAGQARDGHGWPISTPETPSRKAGVGYFNMFDEWAMDPKVQSMSEPLQRRHLMLLCLRNIGDTSDTPDEEVATFMRITVKEALKTKEIFAQKGFIDGNSWRVLHWDKRQSGHSESYDRVKRFRERHRSVTETLPSNGCNVTETLPCNPPAGAYLLTSELTSVTEEPPLSPRGDKRKFVLPSWIPKRQFDDYVEMRRRNRKVMTDRAKELLVMKLERFQADGHDIKVLIELATERCWQTVVVPDDKPFYGRPEAKPSRPPEAPPLTGRALEQAQAAERERVLRIAAEGKAVREAKGL